MALPHQAIEALGFFDPLLDLFIASHSIDQR
jgi:hypothetical protein